LDSSRKNYKCNRMLIKCVSSSSSGNFYILEGVKEIILIEAGIPIKKIKKSLKFDFSKVVGLLCSHSHSDHSKSIKDVARFGINIYLNPGCKEVLGVEGHNINTVSPLEERDIGDEWRVLFFDTQHNCIENDPMGFLILHKLTNKKVLFATDTFYLRYKFPDLNCIMVEANYDRSILEHNVAAGIVPTAIRDRIITSHFEIENLKKFFRANDLSRLEKTILLHLSDNNSDEAKFKREIEIVTRKPVYIANLGFEVGL